MTGAAEALVGAREQASDSRSAAAPRRVSRMYSLVRTFISHPWKVPAHGASVTEMYPSYCEQSSPPACRFGSASGSGCRGGGSRPCRCRFALEG